MIPHENLISVGLEVPLKPLILHQRISSIDTATTLPLSVIKIAGKFDTSEALIWIANCIPDVPSNIEGKTELIFKSALLGTFLILQIGPG